MRIILDGMGGDNAPSEIVKGAVEAAASIDGEIIITGDELKISEELKKCGYNKEKIRIRATGEVIENCDSPVKAIRTKKDSSMVVGLEMLKNGEGDLFISAGNTGALLAGSLFILGRVQGIDRPALAMIYPVLGAKPSLLVDSGANVDCKPENMLEFASMGSIYMEKVLGRIKPSIALINVGAEETKGNTAVKSAYEMLEKSSLNFVGNIEGRDIPFAAADVLVCDGFVGNVVLKLTEGMALSMMSQVKKKFTEGIKAKMGAALLYDKVKDLKKEFDYSEYGGAPILGVKKPVIKMHGSSNANAVKNTIIKGMDYAEKNVVQTIADSVLELEEIRISE